MVEGPVRKCSTISSALWKTRLQPRLDVRHFKTPKTQSEVQQGMGCEKTRALSTKRKAGLHLNRLAHSV